MLENLNQYIPTEDEKKHHADIMNLIKQRPGCFYRTYFNPGHVTGSALLLSEDETKVLMNHHKFLKIWICFGGHADGDKNIFNVAKREVIEESGIENIEPIMFNIFDVDVHDIPSNPQKNEPAHKHFDIRYLFRVKKKIFENFTQSEESNDLRWCTYEEAKGLASPKDISMHRLLDKWHDGAYCNFLVKSA